MSQTNRTQVGSEGLRLRLFPFKPVDQSSRDTPTLKSLLAADLRTIQRELAQRELLGPIDEPLARLDGNPLDIGHLKNLVPVHKDLKPEIRAAILAYVVGRNHRILPGQLLTETLLKWPKRAEIELTDNYITARLLQLMQVSPTNKDGAVYNEDDKRQIAHHAASLANAAITAYQAKTALEDIDNRQDAAYIDLEGLSTILQNIKDIHQMVFGKHSESTREELRSGKRDTMPVAA